MRKNAGWIAAVTVILAVFGVSNLPKGGSESESPTSGVSETKNALRAKNQSKSQSDACEELRKRIQPFVKDAAKWHLADSCSGTPQPLPKSPLVDDKLKVIIATAPNPISTHLPLMFDRIIEVIQQAAQDENYSYNSSWFPWDNGTEYTFLDDQHRADAEREALQVEPGVITFRGPLSADFQESSYSGGLIVFVVAEQPTEGIDSDEFENALQWVDSLGALMPERKLRVLGPTFSGSIPSLRRALDSSRLKRFKGESAIQIISGSVSSETSHDWLIRSLDCQKLGTFDTYMESDDVMAKRFIDYITSQHFESKNVAFLSEDETAFGSQQTKTQNRTDGPVYLYYPRDIAALRAAYQEQSILGTGKPATGNAPSSSLRGDLTEPENSRHDTVRTYGGQLDPLAQESLLLNISNILTERHVQFVVIRSTNSLDQIFLTQFLRRVCPEARVVIDGSDLLFRRGAEGSSLRGVMTLSTYPLLVWQSDWTPSGRMERNGSYRVFGQDVSEGIYIAARELLKEESSVVPISNYALPSWAAKSAKTPDRSATWLSVIGHHQFWPVAILGQGDTIIPKMANFSDGAITPLRIGPELEFVMVAVLLWGVLHLLWCVRGSIVPTIAAFRLASFAPATKKQHPLLISFGSLMPALATLVTSASIGLLKWSYWDVTRQIVIAAWALTLIAVSTCACVGNYSQPAASSKPFHRNSRLIWQAVAGGVAVLIFLALTAFYLYLANKLTDENAIPLFWRSAHLLSGVSPLLPQLLLIAGLYAWFWFSLRGLALCGEDKPRLPKESQLMALDNVSNTPAMPMFSREGVEKPLERVAVTFSRFHLRCVASTIAVALVVFGMALYTPGEWPWPISVRTLGEKYFGILIYVWLSVCMGLVLADTIQMWSIWKRLRFLLLYLDRLPLRRTLAALKGMSWGSVWRMSGHTLDERYRVISRQTESLRHLENCLRSWAPDNTSPEKQAGELFRKEQLLDRIAACQEKRKEFVAWYVTLCDKKSCDVGPLHQFQEELASTAGSVLKNLLVPAWQDETVSLVFNRKTTSDEKEEGSQAAFLTEHVPPHVLAGEEFFVLPYLAFIQNVLGRMRTILLGSLFLFVATTLAMSSYPFDPLPVLGAVFLGVFAVTGGTMIVVFAQMNRDTTLSHITNTNPGELGGHFWVQLITFGVGPLFGLLTTLFPAMTDFVASWLQPSVQALK